MANEELAFKTTFLKQYQHEIFPRRQARGASKTLEVASVLPWHGQECRQDRGSIFVSVH